MPKAFLFDLDMTLVDSSALADLRRQRMWTQVAASMHLIRPYKVEAGAAAHEVPGKLKARNIPVAVVTSSPRRYAEAVIKAFNIECDALVTYEDTTEHKPDPAPVIEGLKQLGVKASREVFYVGDDGIDVEAAYHAGVSSIGVGWGIESLFGMSSTAPDMLIDEPKQMLRAIELDQLSYIGERLAADEKYSSHWGSVLHCDDHQNEVYALGRYMTAGDPRHAGHQLSRAILSLKSSDKHADMFGKALGKAIALIETEAAFIVPVPPKPSQTRNRFEAVLAAAEVHLPDDVEIDLEGLKCVKGVEGYKSMGPGERAAAIRGAFETKWDWDGADVILIDDVYTTGETIAECARILKKQGAGTVQTVVLGKDQRAFVRKRCECGRTMKIRKNRHGVQFWGCSGYPAYCQRTEDL